jgi:hypothetical protein
MSANTLLTTTLNFRQRKLCLTLQIDSLEFRHKGWPIVPALSLTSKQSSPRLIFGDREGTLDRIKCFTAPTHASLAVRTPHSVLD